MSKNLDLDIGHTIPDNLSSVVWGLKDGVAFVRYLSEEEQSRVEFRVLPVTLEQWGQDYLIIPTSAGEISLAKAGFPKSLVNIHLENIRINDVNIPYVEISHAKYEKGELKPATERALLDFQMTLLGIQTQSVPNRESDTGSDAATIEKLEALALEYENLLVSSRVEEELQAFLKRNCFVLHQSANIIPKMKLGNDFITDFVLVITNDQGPTYILVELEKATYPILTKSYALSSQTNQALKQTRDWDIWLEANQAYIRNKLPNFEGPNYMIVIGRSSELDDTAKAYLRSYNRDWKNIELLSYDDILVRYRGVINSLSEQLCNSQRLFQFY